MAALLGQTGLASGRLGGLAMPAFLDRRGSRTWLWYALALHRAGDRAAARQALAQASRHGPATGSWTEQVAYDRLRREVEALPGLMDIPAPR